MFELIEKEFVKSVKWSKWYNVPFLFFLEWPKFEGYERKKFTKITFVKQMTYNYTFSERVLLLVSENLGFMTVRTSYRVWGWFECRRWVVKFYSLCEGQGQCQHT